MIMEVVTFQQFNTVNKISNLGDISVEDEVRGGSRPS